MGLVDVLSSSNVGFQICFCKTIGIAFFFSLYFENLFWAVKPWCLYAKKCTLQVDFPFQRLGYSKLKRFITMEYDFELVNVEKWIRITLEKLVKLGVVQFWDPFDMSQIVFHLAFEVCFFVLFSEVAVCI